MRALTLTGKRDCTVPGPWIVRATLPSTATAVFTVGAWMKNRYTGKATSNSSTPRATPPLIPGLNLSFMVESPAVAFR